MNAGPTSEVKPSCAEKPSHICDCGSHRRPETRFDCGSHSGPIQHPGVYELASMAGSPRRPLSSKALEASVLTSPLLAIDREGPR
jgi:hypothetical protein